MQLPLMRGSPESTVAVMKLAKPMFVMNRPRLSTCRMGSFPSSHSATLMRPATTPVSTPTKGRGSVSANAPRSGTRSSPGCAGAMARW